MSTLMSPSLLRTRGEASGGHWAAFTLTGALVFSGPAGRLQEDVAPRPLWQELPGSSGPKLRLLEDGGHIHVDRSPGLLRTHGEASGGCGATFTLTGR